MVHDLIIYGATPAGIVAAHTACSHGLHLLLLVTVCLSATLVAFGSIRVEELQSRLDANGQRLFLHRLY